MRQKIRAQRSAPYRHHGFKPDYPDVADGAGMAYARPLVEAIGAKVKSGAVVQKTAEDVWRHQSATAP